MLFEAATIATPFQFAEAFGVVTLTGYQPKYFVGDTSDPYNPGTYASPWQGQPGITVVHGTSAYPLTSAAEQEETLTSYGGGKVAYSGSFTSTAANNNCSGGGGTLSSGTIGTLDPSNGTTTEHILKGTPAVLQTDNAGNVWFIEYSGTCNGTKLLPSGYGIGELSASGTITEKDFGAAGIAANAYPNAMSIRPDGTEMYIGDSAHGQIVQVTLPAVSSPIAASAVNSKSPFVMATAPDGTTVWASFNTTSKYWYGFIPGTSTFGTASVNEAVFPVHNFIGYSAAYADSSIWIPGYTTHCLGRFIITTSSGAATTVRPTCISAGASEPYFASAGGGYIWGLDYNNTWTAMAIQYGAPPNGTTPLVAERRTIGQIVMPSAAMRPAYQRNHRTH